MALLWLELLCILDALVARKLNFSDISMDSKDDQSETFVGNFTSYVQYVVYKLTNSLIWPRIRTRAMSLPSRKSPHFSCCVTFSTKSFWGVGRQNLRLQSGFLARVCSPTIISLKIKLQYKNLPRNLVSWLYRPNG